MNSQEAIEYHHHVLNAGSNVPSFQSSITQKEIEAIPLIKNWLQDKLEQDIANAPPEVIVFLIIIISVYLKKSNI